MIKQRGGDASAAGEIDRIVAEIGTIEEQIAADQAAPAGFAGS